MLTVLIQHFGTLAWRCCLIGLHYIRFVDKVLTLTKLPSLKSKSPDGSSALSHELFSENLSFAGDHLGFWVTFTPQQNKNLTPALSLTFHLLPYCPETFNAYTNQWNIHRFLANLHDYEMLHCLWPNSSRYYFCWKWVIALFSTGQACGYASCRCLAALCSFIQPCPQRTGYMISVQNNSIHL